MKTKIIRYKDHKFLYTDDNWKTIRVSTRAVTSGVEEKSKDIENRVKLRYELGEEKAKVIINELNFIRKNFPIQESGDGYGHAFEIFAIAVLYNLDYDYVYNNFIVKGNLDGKIDAIYWKGDTNYIYQVKMDTLEDASDIDTMIDNYVRYVKKEKLQEPAKAEDFMSFCESHEEEIRSNKKSSFVVISNNIRSRKVTNIEPGVIFAKYFENILMCRENNITLSLDAPGDNIAFLSDEIYVYIGNSKKFIESLLSCDGINGKIENLYKFYYDNVRGCLGSNVKIKNTINNEPENFVKYNNGVTITGKIKYLEETNAFVITNPIISNGQQTIWNLVEEYPNIEDVNLLIIIKNESDDIVKQKISEYTNSQRKISPSDLLSLNANLRSIQKEIFERTIGELDINNRYYLDLNTSGTRNYHKLLKSVYSKNNIISLKDFCRVYFSVEDKNTLGDWKNYISYMIENIEKDTFYDYKKSIKVCNIISKYKTYVKTLSKQDKDDLSCADLAFMYLMYIYNMDEAKAHEIIRNVNKKYYYDLKDHERPSKLINLYMNNNIYKKLEEFVVSKKEKVRS